MKRFLFATIAVALMLVQAVAGPQNQKGYGVYGENIEERASSRIGYWRTDVNAGIGEVVVSYGRPPWNEKRSQQMEQLRGRMWRLGDNYWSLLDTNLPIRLGNLDVPVGLYYLAVARSQDGEDWELVLIDPEKSRAKGLDSYDVGTRPGEIPVLMKTPMKFKKLEGETVEKLTILLKTHEGSDTEGAMTVSWGDFQLSVPVEVKMP